MKQDGIQNIEKGPCSTCTDREKDKVTETPIQVGDRNGITASAVITYVNDVPTQIGLGGIHSHPLGSAGSRPSAADLACLLLPTIEFGASSFSMITSRRSNLAIFRGRNSPQLPFEQLVEHLKASKKIINRAYGISSIARGELPSLMRGLPLGQALVARMAQDYDLQFFQGKRGSAVLHRKLISQLSP